MTETLLYLLKPILELVPEVRNPGSKISFKDKMLWTAITLFIYLLCCQIPLYGVFKTSGADPLYWMRVILASNKGTLMELGISPLITSNMIVELLANSRMITYDPSVALDRSLLKSVEKLLSIIVSFGTAFVYVFAGMYGSVESLGTFKALMIVLQLTIAAIMIIYLDEMLQNGYGIGSGISLFIATNICESVLWRAFSPVTIKTENGIEFEGAVIAMVHFLFTKNNKMNALYLSFYRSNLVNMHNIIATIFIFAVVIYFQGFEYNIKLTNRNIKGSITNYPIKLFYLSNTPIILQTALISNLHVISQILYKRFGSYWIIRMLGVWKSNTLGGPEKLEGGLAYYLVPPNTFTDILYNPTHFIIYLIFIISSCALFSKFWLELSGRSTTDVLRQFHENDMIITGYNSDNYTYKQLKKSIPIAAVFGGMCIGLLSVISDLLGTIGSGTGLLLVVNIIYGYFEQFSKESDKFEKFRKAVEF
jgi:protein transport protein SEC61 subunit alpha